jgi:hypothetical protein
MFDKPIFDVAFGHKIFDVSNKIVAPYIEYSGKKRGGGDSALPSASHPGEIDWVTFLPIGLLLGAHCDFWKAVESAQRILR